MLGGTAAEAPARGGRWAERRWWTVKRCAKEREVASVVRSWSARSSDVGYFGITINSQLIRGSHTAARSTAPFLASSLLRCRISQRR